MLFFICLIIAGLVWGLIMAAYLGLYESFEDGQGMPPDKAAFYAAAIVALLVGIVIATISCDVISDKLMHNAKEKLETTVTEEFNK
jgi:hypothetical protein